MPQLLLVKATVGPLDWLPLLGVLSFYGACVLALLVAGSHRSRIWLVAFFERIADSLERVTGMPGWSAAGVLSGLAFLLIAVIGLYWDVAWHIDLGRDRQLLTPPHVMILVGLGGLAYAAAVSVIFASVQRAPVGPLSAGLVRVPWSSIPLLLMGAGGFLAFPVDALWHDAFGIDVTLWSPTHLQLVTAGALGTVAVWLMVAEGLPGARSAPLGRLIHHLVAGAALVGLSAYQGEFDFGVPQFQLLFLPLLVVGASAFVLVPARAVLGPWGALRTVGVYLTLRIALGALVGGPLGLGAPGCPLYLGAALAVEAAALVAGTERRLRFAAVAGFSVGTAGLALEVPWLHALGWPLAGDLLPQVAILGPVLGAAAAVLGAGLVRAFTPDGRPLGAPAALLAAVAAAAVLAVPLPRNVGTVDAVIRIDHPAGGSSRVSVVLTPPDAADNATLFGVSSWQGGGRDLSGFTRVAAGSYVSSREVPVGGAWKTVVALERGDEVMAAPVFLPADPDIGAPAIPALRERHARFVRNTDLLLREQHGGPAGIAALGWGSLASWLAVWACLIALVVTRIGRGEAWRETAGRPALALGAAEPSPAPMSVYSFYR